MERVIGHRLILRELRALATSEEPAHALLLAGPESTGRMALALQYAMMLNCELSRTTELPVAGASLFDLGAVETVPVAGREIPCGECRSCRLIDEGSHPDVVVVTPGDTLCRPRGGESSHDKHPDSRDIRICQVRGMIDLVARYPFEAKYRVVIIDPADRLAREAAHTLLKTLEEPPGHTAFVLISAAPESIIETVISRCRRINVRTVPRAEIEEGLVAQGVEPGLAAQCAEAARGRVGLAISYAAKPDLMGDRERLLELCGSIAAGRSAERFSYAGTLADQWRKDRSVVHTALDMWEVFWEERLRHADPSDVEGMRGIIGAMEAVIRCRGDLLTQVQTRAALEFMLLSFPRVTLAGTTGE